MELGGTVYVSMKIAHMASWDASRPGASAMDAVYERCLDMEIGSYKSRLYGGCTVGL